MAENDNPRYVKDGNESPGVVSVTTGLASLIQVVSDQIQKLDAEPKQDATASYQAGRRGALAWVYWEIGRIIDAAETVVPTRSEEAS